MKMARILGKRRPGEPQPIPRRVISGRFPTGRLGGIRRLIKRDEAKGITFPDMQGAIRVGVKAFLTTAFAGANNDLTFRAKKFGVAGNSIRVAFVVPASVQPLNVVVAGNDITINVGTSAASTPNSTAEQVRNQVNGHPTAALLVSAEFATGNDGTGVVAAMALTNLANGVDEGGLVRAGPGIPDRSSAGIVRQKPQVPPSSNDPVRRKVPKATPGPIEKRP